MARDSRVETFAALRLHIDTWRWAGVVEPILGAAAPLAEYEPGTWGPATARAVVASEQGWQDPKREDTAPC